MARNTFATLGIFVVLLLSFGLTSALVEDNNVSIALDQTSISDVVTGTQYTITATIDNQNTTSFYVEFRTTGWDSWTEGKNIAAGTNDTFTGTFTAAFTTAETATKGVYADIYNASNTSQLLFTIESTLALTYATFCEQEDYNETNHLEISDFDINNNGEGSDDEWEYLDQIEITVEIENTDNEDVEDVEVTIRILDDKGVDKTSKFDFDKKTIESIGRLRDDDKEEVTFIIDELSSDLTEGDYYMYIMAYGEDEDGNDQCISEIDGDSYFFEFTIVSVDYEDSIVARGLDLVEQINVYCGQENLEITVPIYNLGDDDEEKVLVNLYSSSMGIDKYIVINDLDNGDKEIVTFFIDIPLALENERYNLEILTSFDWDDDRDDEDETSYEEQTTESIRLNILGCAAPEPTVQASLESKTEVGAELVVKAIVTNNGDLADFIITATGFENWAELISVTPSTVEIASGNSQEVTITLSPKQSGVQAFEIITTIDGETFSQSVSVNISEKQYPLGLSKIAFYSGTASAVLVVLILFTLIARLARRPTAQATF